MAKHTVGKSSANSTRQLRSSGRTRSGNRTVRYFQQRKQQKVQKVVVLAAAHRISKKIDKTTLNKRSTEAQLALSRGHKNRKKSNNISIKTTNSISRSALHPVSGVSIAITCAANKAKLYLSRYSNNEKCVLFNDQWYSPQEFETISGRGAARDWKRTIKHSGQCIKALLSDRILTLIATRHTPVQCLCHECLSEQQVQPAVDQQQTEEGQSVSGAGERVTIEVSQAQNIDVPSPTRTPPQKKQKKSSTCNSKEESVSVPGLDNAYDEVPAFDSSTLSRKVELAVKVTTETLADFAAADVSSIITGTMQSTADAAATHIKSEHSNDDVTATTLAVASISTTKTSITVAPSTTATSSTATTSNMPRQPGNSKFERLSRVIDELTKNKLNQLKSSPLLPSPPPPRPVAAVSLGSSKQVEAAWEPTNTPVATLSQECQVLDLSSRKIGFSAVTHPIFDRHCSASTPFTAFQSSVPDQGLPSPTAAAAYCGQLSPFNMGCPPYIFMGFPLHPQMLQSYSGPAAAHSGSSGIPSWRLAAPLAKKLKQSTDKLMPSSAPGVSYSTRPLTVTVNQRHSAPASGVQSAINSQACDLLTSLTKFTTECNRDTSSESFYPRMPLSEQHVVDLSSKTKRCY